ncbi:putative solute symporter protein [Rhodothermus marinus SG0.5JP17-172]|uniref:DUF4212 domain-containing protein n=1 Tax=Rhodothermus marinus TaxID=29549 RepID=UPI000223D958|nr:DUF4212 domain-containing protein [Rhodothermus marinus]AEN73475.1 putative solute symporter protein [Rhodothermus marinus SG0.5JP17-172]MBO2491230.1 DUF4212 domain-containing protein [Rhodothermus marinus]
MAQMDRKTYWREVRKRTFWLLVIWFIVGYVLSIFLVEPLNTLKIAGVPMGFWMAQQGSIMIFILLILAYAIMMGKLDRAAGVEEDAGTTAPPSQAH